MATSEPKRGSADDYRPAPRSWKAWALMGSDGPVEEWGALFIYKTARLAAECADKNERPVRVVITEVPKGGSK